MHIRNGVYNICQFPQNCHEIVIVIDIVTCLEMALTKYYFTKKRPETKMFDFVSDSVHFTENKKMNHKLLYIEC